MKLNSLILAITYAVCTLPQPAFAARGLSPQMASIIESFYPIGTVAVLDHPEYYLTAAKLTWIKPKEAPYLYMIYHRAVPFYKHGVTLHFSSVIRHEPQKRTFQSKFKCNADQQQEIYQHPQLGPYFLCRKVIVTRPHPKYAGASLLYHQLVSAWPMPGNAKPEISFHIAGFKTDIDSLLASLHLE